jgi:hypothetical protein
MSTEDRLRAAITARTTSIEPSPDALHRIEEKLMDAERATNRNRWLIGIGSVAAVAAVIVGVLALTDDDDPEVDTVGTTTTSSTESTTTSEVTTTTVTVPAQVDPAVPVFPDATAGRRFDDPVVVASTFATEVLGFRDPVVGDYAAGDSRSGEVEVRSFAQGRPTVIIVRQLEDDHWYVLAAVAENIRLDVPAAGATLSSPQPLEGAASAFEGTVNVLLYADGEADPVGETFVTGSGDAALGDFSGELEFSVPAGVEHGVLVLLEASAEDGRTVAATAIRVHFT